MKPLKSKGDDVCLEITQRCYNKCPWCYKGQLVGPKMPYIPFETVKERFLWACKFVEFDKVFPLGGEPLTHPQLIPLIKLFLSHDKKVGIITSGRVSNHVHEKENYEGVLDLYEQGLITIDVSFQPGRNEKYYTKMVADLRARSLKRHKALAITGKPNSDYDVFSTIVVDESHLSIEKYMTSVNTVVRTLFDEDLDPQDVAAVHKIHSDLKLHFEDYEKSDSWRLKISPKSNSTDFRAFARFVGEVQCSGAVVKKPQGGTCPAIRTEISENVIVLQSFLIRHDGEICFSLPQCISARSGLCNTGLVDQEKDIYDAVKASIDVLIQNILDGKRLQASSPNNFCEADPEYPKGSPDAKICPSCNFKYICNLCH